MDNSQAPQITDVETLHVLEVKILRSFNKNDEISLNCTTTKLGYNEGQFNQSTVWLSSKNLIQVAKKELKEFYELTPLGQDFIANSSYEERLLENLKKNTANAQIDGLSKQLNIESDAIGSVFGVLSKEGVVKIDESRCIRIVDQNKGDRLINDLNLILGKFKEKKSVFTDSLSQPESILFEKYAGRKGKHLSFLKKKDRTEITYTITDLGLTIKEQISKKGMTGDEIGTLTPAIIQSGEWRQKGFRKFNLNIPPTRVLIGRRNPYKAVINAFKDKCIAMGFEEMEGPIIEVDFWNCDALYMPQFHPARDIHDVYYVKNRKYAKSIEPKYIDAVAGIHKNGGKTGSLGWGYEFDRKMAHRLIFRSQGTAVSARKLASLKSPGKYFAVARCFRYDHVDATHLPDFYQAEGLVVGADINIKMLFGLLEIMAKEVAKAQDIKFVPSYFPFTEPSFEVHIKHSEIGWFELGGMGIFRPEVLAPFNIEHRVLAWGLGLDRMAMMSLKVNDIRKLFSANIDEVRYM